MVNDREVEKALLEIRQNLQAEIDARAATGVAPNVQVLWQLESHLTVTERAWSRLPPLVSNRQGWRAQIELWFKRLLKRATHWYVWEQINFNAATNESLHTVRMALARQEQQQSALRTQLEELAANIRRLETVNAEPEELRQSTQGEGAFPSDGGE